MIGAMHDHLARPAPSVGCQGPRESPFGGGREEKRGVGGIEKRKEDIGNYKLAGNLDTSRVKFVIIFVTIY